MTRFRWITTVALVSLLVAGPALLHTPRFPKPAGVGYMTPVLHGKVAAQKFLSTRAEIRMDSIRTKLAKKFIYADMKLAKRFAVHAQYDPCVLEGTPGCNYGNGSYGFTPCDEIIDSNTIVYTMEFVGQVDYLGVVFDEFYIETNEGDGVCFD